MGRRGPKPTGPEDNERNRLIFELRDQDRSFREIRQALIERYGEGAGEVISVARIGNLIRRRAEAEMAGR